MGKLTEFQLGHVPVRYVTVITGGANSTEDCGASDCPHLEYVIQRFTKTNKGGWLIKKHM